MESLGEVGQSVSWPSARSRRFEGVSRELLGVHARPHGGSGARNRVRASPPGSAGRLPPGLQVCTTCGRAVMHGKEGVGNSDGEGNALVEL
eukprot:5788067-Prymnesium_polylepis.1